MMMQFNSVMKFRNSVTSPKIFIRKKKSKQTRNDKCEIRTTQKEMRNSKIEPNTGHVMCEEFSDEYFMRLYLLIQICIENRREGVTYTYLQYTTERVYSTVKYVQWLSVFHSSYYGNEDFSSLRLFRRAHTHTQYILFIFLYFTAQNIKQLGVYLMSKRKNSKHETMTRVSVYLLRILNLRYKHTHTHTHNRNGWIQWQFFFQHSSFILLKSFSFFLIKTIFSCLFSMVYERLGGTYIAVAMRKWAIAMRCMLYKLRIESQVFCVRAFFCVFQNITIIVKPE